VWYAVDDVSSVSEVSDNETDDDNDEPMSTNTCSDCHATGELTASFLVIATGVNVPLPLVHCERLRVKSSTPGKKYNL